MSLPYAKKQLGQHWLEDFTSLQAMITDGQVNADDFVLEIGPGTGTLTHQLTESGAKILALEYDNERYRDLKKAYSNISSVELVQGDVRSFDFNNLPKDYKIVANIPYYLTANLMRLLSDVGNKPKTAVLLVQKEVAERLSAKSGDLSIVAIFAQNYYDIKKTRVVRAELFTPPPKVDSQIVVLERRNSPLIAIDEDLAWTIKAGFAQKRKKLYSSLASGLGLSKQEVKQHLKNAGVNPDIRAQDVEITEWAKISKSIKNS